MSVPQWRDKERATQPDNPKRPRSLGCADFSPLRRCSSVTDHSGYAPWSRLGETKNRQQRGMVEYFNRLLSACDRRVVFGAMVRLDRHVDQFVVSAQQRSIRLAALRFVGDDGNHRGKFSDADLPHMQIGHD